MTVKRLILLLYDNLKNFVKKTKKKKKKTSRFDKKIYKI